ncbi:MAG: glyceraldehyde 3-phosphate dehydrogenase NAD-binding domain-containing protein [bacterium]|nr:glyceraldehyde 3-phosphate dehydrogenase NAD-binding domain-containing protein [bacterium]
MIRVGLNGFGRIGRAITRIAEERDDIQIVVINEIDPDIKNSAYLFKYDSVYGKLRGTVSANQEAGTLTINDREVNFVNEFKGLDVNWEKFNIDVLIDATGLQENVLAAKEIVKRGVPKVVITHSPNNVDLTVILGVNENEYDPKQHDVVSSSICDASAIAPILFEVDKQWGVENCFITTLHPWLSYQNLLDGTVRSISNPGHFWDEYSLGRSSVMSLIPKDTTAGKATIRVLPQLNGKLEAISFRVPTNIVSVSDITIQVREETSVKEISEHFNMKSRNKNNVFEFQEESLVSIDHLGTEKSATIDAKRIRVLNKKMIKMVVSYDNEWGYSNRVLDIVKLVNNADI